MYRLYVLVGRHAPEIWALFFTTIFLVGGLYLAWNREAAWLSRAGALIIIVGVLLAASRFHEWVQGKVGHFVEEHLDTTVKDVIANFEKESGPIGDRDRNTIRSTAKNRVHEELNAFFDKEKRRVKHLEVALIVAGTFLNGLGEYLIELLKNNGT